MKTVIEFLSRRYSLLKFRTFRWLFTFTGPTIAFIYILVKKPFGFGLFDTSEQIRLALFYSIPVMLIWGIHLFLLQPRLIRKLNILNSVIYLVWINFFIGCYYYAFSEIYIFGAQFDFYWLPMTLKNTMLLGAVVTVIMVGIHSGYLIRNRVLRKKQEQVAHFLE
jgi:hypothetical protein